MSLFIPRNGYQRRNRDAAVEHFLAHFGAELLGDGFVKYEDRRWRVTANTNPKFVMLKNTSTEERDGGVRDTDIHEYIHGHIMYRQMKDSRLVVYFVTDLDQLGEKSKGRAQITWDELKPLVDSYQVFKAPEAS